MTKLTRKETAQAITKGVVTYYAKKGWGVNTELGLCKSGKLRADVLAMAFKGYIVIVETKSCVADFVSDSKCKRYMKFCNQFYFAFTPDVWAKLEPRVEFPPTVGVMVCPPGGKITIVKKSKRREIAESTVYRVALRAAYRGAQYRCLADVHNGGRFK